MFLWNKKKIDNNGERVDIDYYHMDYNKFDIYQKSHYKRYEFAKNYLKNVDICADLACGTGYGSLMLSEKCNRVTGIDINSSVIDIIKKKYKKQKKVTFLTGNLLNLKYENEFDTIISFETIEHFKQEEISKLFLSFSRAIKAGGLIIFSTPYNQEKTDIAIKMGFHLTFNIVEKTIEDWLKNAGFVLETFKYQNYQNPQVLDLLEQKDFIISIGRKI